MKRVPVLFSLVSAIGLIVAFSPAFASAQHLDRMETRRVIRHVSEKTDAMQDDLDDWLSARQDQRMHQAEELNHQLDDFETQLMTLRSQVIAHQEPWDVRDQAKTTVDSARQLRRVIEHARYLPGNVRSDWEALRPEIDHLAHQFHLDPLK